MSDDTSMEYWRQAYDDMLDDMLDEMHPDIFRLTGSTILSKLDPIAYREGFYDYLDSEGIDSDTLEDDE